MRHLREAALDVAFQKAFNPAIGRQGRAGGGADDGPTGRLFRDHHAGFGQGRPRLTRGFGS